MPLRRKGAKLLLFYINYWTCWCPLFSSNSLDWNKPKLSITGKSLNWNRQASSVSDTLWCSCQAQDGTQKISLSFQSKRFPLIIEYPFPFAHWYTNEPVCLWAFPLKPAGNNYIAAPIVCITCPPVNGFEYCIKIPSKGFTSVTFCVSKSAG